MNPDLLKRTWDEVSAYEDAPILDFYARLYLANPGIEDLFPRDMRLQRIKLHRTITQVIDAAGNLDTVIADVQRLGRDHRRFGATAKHYPAVAKALLETLEYYLDDQWTPDVADAWTTALTTVAAVMVDAAQVVEDTGEPACWLAPVLAVDHHDDIVHITVDPGPTFPYTPGCRVPIALVDEPGTERHYRPESHADTSVLTIHVRRTHDPITLALLNDPGTQLRLGAPLPPEEPAP